MRWKARLTALAVGMLAIAAACAPGDESEETDLVSRAIAAVTPPGSILHMEGKEWPPEGDNPRSLDMWLDGDEDRFRLEKRREWPGGSAVRVWVGVGWEMTSYDSDANNVSRQSFPAEYQARLQEPAAFALGYLWSLVMADEWRFLDEKSEGGRTILVIEARTVVMEEDPRLLDADPGTVFVTVIELDKDTLWPVWVRAHKILPEGEVQQGVAYQIDVVELLSPKDVPDELFSPEAVESLYMTMEEKLEQARAQGFALYWLGERYVADLDEAALVLRDVLMTQSVPWQVVVSYRPEEVWASWVTIYEGSESWTPKATGAPDSYSSRDVVVRGVAGVLHISQGPRGFPSHSLMFSLSGTTIELATAPTIKYGQDENPFNNPEALLSLAEALVTAE